MAFDKAKVVSAAEKHLAQGKIPAAIEEYRRIVEQDAGDFTALNTLGDLYVRVNKKREAVPSFLRVAEHYREQGFALKAIAVYKKIARLDPNTPDITRHLATLYEQQGLVVEARAQYLSIVEACTRAGQTREALEAMRRIADLDPQNVSIRVRLAEGYEREGLSEEAAEAYAEAGGRLLAKDEAREALQAYQRAQGLRPHSQAVLQGLISTHFALGAPHEAAAVLESAVAAAPGDLELRALLARAYLEVGDAPAAEGAVSALVKVEGSNYPLLFEVARLYLRKGSVPEAVQALTRAIEPGLAGRQEATLLELLNEALTRDAEQIEALRLLLRIYTWLRDDERMRVTLERLAEAARSSNLVDEERRALEHLVRLAPLDQDYRERLEALGDAPEFLDASEESFDELATTTLTGDVPQFENVLGGAAEPFTAVVTPFDTVGNEAGAFEWNSVAASESVAAEPSASFADLSAEFAESDARRRPAETMPPAQFVFSEEHEIHLTDAFAEASNGSAPRGGSDVPPVSVLLAQELESVDYYLAQGYIDIARDTLDMLERQYGDQAEIAARRRQLSGGAAPSAKKAGGESFAPAEQDFTGFEITTDPAPAAAGEEIEIDASMFIAPTAEAPPRPAAAPPQPSSPPLEAGIDPGLAAIFDEFRLAVEETQPDATEDFETHYNLGLAYKDMGLMDEAVEEFQTAINLVAPQDGTPRYLQCCNMLGHCFMQKGMARPAAMWFAKGLESPGHTQDEYQALRYELGAAYEELEDLDKAIETYSVVYGFDVSYRGVADKLRDLQGRKTVASGK